MLVDVFINFDEQLYTSVIHGYLRLELSSQGSTMLIRDRPFRDCRPFRPNPREYRRLVIT